LAPSIKGGLLLLLGVNLGNPAKVSVDRGLKVKKSFVLKGLIKAIYIDQTIRKGVMLLALAAWTFR